MLALPMVTDRLLLRRFTIEDLEVFQGYRSDPEVALYQGWEPMPDREARAYLAEQATQVLGASGQWLQVAVARYDTGALIGDIGLCVIDEPGGVVELGYTIMREHQRKGYGAEAVRGVIAALLGGGQVRSVVATTDTRNHASLALLRRIGLTHVRTTATTFRGAPCEEATFEISARKGE